MIIHKSISSRLYPLYKAGLKLFNIPLHLPLTCTGQKAQELIKNKLLDDSSCMIARFGESELNVVIAYLNKKLNIRRSVRGTLRREVFSFQRRRWFDCGFFKSDNDFVIFAEQMIMDIPQLDILGCWLPTEIKIKHFLNNCHTVKIADLQPFNSIHPWTMALKWKKVLVIHPYEQSIKKQYAKRDCLFTNKDILPEFELLTLKPIIYTDKDMNKKFPSWVDALEFMYKEIDKIDFDIAIIGAGPFSFSLAAHIKRIGKKAFHLGGATQLLFGIKGKRWDVREFSRGFYNEHWIRPSESEIKGLAKIEHGCYT